MNELKASIDAELFCCPFAFVPEESAGISNEAKPSMAMSNSTKAGECINEWFLGVSIETNALILKKLN